MGTMRRVWLFAFLPAVATALGLSGCRHAVDPWDGQAGPPRVVVSFAPLYCFTRNVAGPDAGVLCLLINQGPHGYEANPRDAVLLHKADLFLVNGLGLDESFADKLKNNADNPKLELVEVGEAVPESQLHRAAEEAGHDHGHHHHGTLDPHVWLGLPEARLMVQRIRDELKKKDSAHAQGYDDRAAAYLKKLSDLEAYGKEKLQPKKGEKRRLIAFHDSLYYFTRTFGLEVAGTVEKQPDVEPNAGEVGALVKLCKEQNVRVIAVEPQYPEKTSAQTLLHELHGKGVKDAAFVVVDPLETANPDDLQNLDWYERKLRENIDNLAKQFP